MKSRKRRKNKSILLQLQAQEGKKWIEEWEYENIIKPILDRNGK